MRRLAFRTSAALASAALLAACSGGSGVTPSLANAPMTQTSLAARRFGAIIYKGPHCKARTKGCLVRRPEIVLYSRTPNTPGYSATFKVTQSGWGKPFTYKFAAVKGFKDNCPKAGTPSYVVSPASGKKGHIFHVHAKKKAKAGECAMTLTGGGGKTRTVRLTYTTSGIITH